VALTRPAAPEHGAVLGGTARSGALNLAAAGFSGTAGLAVTMLVARGLGHPQAGVFFAATSAFVLAQMIAKLGTDTGLVYWLARLRALRRFDLLHRCLRWMLLPVLVASVAMAALLMLAAPRLATTGWFGADAAHAPQFARQLRLLALFLPLAALSDALLSATRGYRTMRPTALTEKVLRPSLQLAGLLVVLLAGSLTADVAAWAVPYAVSVLVAGWFLSAVDRRARSRPPAEPVGEHRLPAPRTGESPPANLARAVWRFTAPRALSSIAQVGLQRLDVLLVAAMLGFRAAAVYTVATRFIVVGQLANQAIGAAVQPRLAELLVRGDTAAVRSLYQTSTAWVVALTWPLYLLVAAFAPAYLRAFGAGYRQGGAVVVVALLCAAMLVAAACGMVDMVLTMGGRTTWNLANVALAFGVNLAVDLVAIPRLGILGAALGWAGALLAKNLVPLGQIFVVLRLHPFGPATVRATLLAAGLVGVPAAAARLLLGAGPAGLAGALVVALPAYAAGCLACRHQLRLSPTALLGRSSRAH
jgi:O-antigen/teichoic acid export membrane protein